MPEALRLYHPTTIDQAVQVLTDLGNEAKVVAGATALTILYRHRLIAPSALVSIGSIPDLGGIEERDGAIHLGAMVRHRDVEMSEIVRARIPVLADTFGTVGNVRVRNAATVGGVLAESDYASDPPAVFVLLGAVVEVSGPNGQRTIPAREFFIAFYETALEPDEIVTGIRVPIPGAGDGTVYHKFVTRSSEDRPCVGVAALVSLAPDGTTTDLRVAVGAAAETPQRFAELEAIGRGNVLADDAIAGVADAYADAIETLDDMRGSAWYRTEMIRVWVRRAIISARDAAVRPVRGAGVR
jgi:carbon-monoxide dehydrogenase medium subunit